MSSCECPCCWAARISELMNAAQVALKCTGRAGPQRHAGYFGHRHAQVAPGALFQKGAGAGGTSVVHRIVNGNAIAQMDVLGILAANFHDRVHLLVEMARPGRVGGDFVEDIFGAQVGADDFPRRAGRSDQADAAVANLIGQGPQARAQRGHGVALRAQVVRGHHAAGGRIQQTRPWWWLIPHPLPATIGPSGGNCRGGAGMTRTRSAKRLSGGSRPRRGWNRKLGRPVEGFVPRQQSRAPGLEPGAFRPHHKFRVGKLRRARPPAWPRCGSRPRSKAPAAAVVALFPAAPTTLLAMLSCRV